MLVSIAMLYTILYSAAVALALWTARYCRRYYTYAKGLASILFVLFALIALFFGVKMSVSLYILYTALFLCMLGDILLGAANRTSNKVHAKPFVGGSVSFLAAHILFISLYALKTDFGWSDVIVPSAAVIALAIFEKIELVRLKRMRIIAYLYTAAVALMTVMAVEAGLKHPLAAAGFLTGAGAILFFASDFLLLFLYFGPGRSKYLRYWNLAFYYIGIYFLAATAYWY